MNLVDALWDVADAVGRAIGDGLTLAAEILCPRDHLAEERLRSWERAAVAVEDEICDEAEADEEYLYATTWAEYNAQKAASDEPELKLRICTWCYGPYIKCGGRHPIVSPELFDSMPSAAVSAAADPSPVDVQAAGDEGPGPDSVIPQTVGSGRSTDPGAVSTPAPGEAKQCQYANAGGCIDIYACTECPPIDWSVSEDDLTAHLTYDLITNSSAMARRIGERSPLVGSYPMFLAERTARSLLADYRITRRA